MRVSKTIYVFFAIIGITNVLSANQYHIREMAYVSIGGVYGASSNEFFDDYTNVIGGNDVQFEHSPSYGVGLKFWLSEKYRLGVSADYIHSTMKDNFTETDTLGIGVANRNISEDIKMTTIPIFFSIDYLPVEQQFKTYVSLGAGILISKTKWKEEVSSSRNSDFRVGGTLYDATDIRPALRGAIGIELDFDKAVIGTVIGNLTIEMRYSYMFRNLNLYRELKNQLGERSSQIGESVEIFPGYLSLNLQLGIEYFQTIGK